MKAIFYCILLSISLLTTVASAFVKFIPQHQTGVMWDGIKNTYVDLEKNKGWVFYIPFIQKIKTIDDPIIIYTSSSVLIKGNHLLEINSLMICKIKHYQGESHTMIKNRIKSVTHSCLRDVIEQNTLYDLISSIPSNSERISNCVNTESNEELDVVQFNITQINFPKELTKAIAQGMQAAYQLDAAKIRNQGTETAIRIKAEADKAYKVMISEAEYYRFNALTGIKEKLIKFIHNNNLDICKMTRQAQEIRAIMQFDMDPPESFTGFHIPEGCPKLNSETTHKDRKAY